MTPEEILLGFTTALRAAGLAVTHDRTQRFLDAVTVVGLDDQQGTYVAGRATLCTGPQDFPAYDALFAGWFLGDDEPRTKSRRKTPQRVVQAPLEDCSGAGGERHDTLQAAASSAELLRHRDVATLDAAERRRLAELFADLRPAGPRRTSYRRVPSRRGQVDTRRTLRRMLRRLGEPVDVAHRHRSTRPRRVVLLVDVSGSMSSYADALLRLAHRVRSATPATEVFSVGTRVTRLTDAMRRRDPDRAIVEAGHTVPDWSGGTRLGEGLQVFLDRWGQRGLARGAVVVLFSDGWERGDAGLLAVQMARLHRLAHRVVWVNPHKGAVGYQPVQLGMAAALPYVDDFVAGHSMAAFEELLEVVADA